MAALCASEVGGSGVQAVEQQKIARGKGSLAFGMTVAQRCRSGAPELPNSFLQTLYPLRLRDWA
jgi:hypothetical protein